VPDYQYDLVVIGSGPAGQKAAICAAKLRKRVVVTDRRHMLGGASLHTGTIPSKTLREAILYLSGFSQRSFYGKGYSVRTGSRSPTSRSACKRSSSASSRSSARS